MIETSTNKTTKPYTHLCLAEQSTQDFFLTEDDLNQPQKYSKTQIVSIAQVKKKLMDAWEVKESPIQPYFEKIKGFYESLRKEINKLIDQDQRNVEVFLTKVKYHHLPYEANSQAYLEFIRDEYERLDKPTILKLISEADNSELNKHLDKQKQITNFLDVELKKVQEKVLTLKYVLLSKKFQSQLLVPNLSQPSKAAHPDQFVKIYSFFNSRNLLIRLAKLVYRGSENQFEAKSFYNSCNGIQNCMAIVKTSNNKLIGGFTPLPLVHHDEDELGEKGIYMEDKTKKSFIFNITSLKSYSVKDSSNAIKYVKDSPGPCFGEDFCIGKNVTSNIGHSYECDKSIAVDSLEAKVHLLEAQKVDVKQFQVWQLSF